MPFCLHQFAVPHASWLLICPALPLPFFCFCLSFLGLGSGIRVALTPLCCFPLALLRFTILHSTSRLSGSECPAVSRVTAVFGSMCSRRAFSFCRPVFAWSFSAVLVMRPPVLFPLRYSFSYLLPVILAGPLPSRGKSPQQLFLGAAPLPGFFSIHSFLPSALRIMRALIFYAQHLLMAYLCGLLPRPRASPVCPPPFFPVIWHLPSGDPLQLYSSLLRQSYGSSHPAMSYRCRNATLCLPTLPPLSL